MHNAGMWAEFICLARHAIIEARADRKQHVALVHGHVCFVGAMHAEHANAERVVGGKRAQAHQRLGDRITQQAHKLGERFRRPTQDDATARVDHRAFGIED